MAVGHDGWEGSICLELVDNVQVLSRTAAQQHFHFNQGLQTAREFLGESIILQRSCLIRGEGLKEQLHHLLLYGLCIMSLTQVVTQVVTQTKESA